MVAKVALTAAQRLAKLKKRRHLYTKGEQVQLKHGMMKRKYNKKTNLTKLAKKNATPLAFGAGLGLGVLED